MNWDAPLAAEIVSAIQKGDGASLEALLRASPELAASGIVDKRGVFRTMLHVATDWPGHFPNGVAAVKTLIAHGADVNARVEGPHTETPLHWAASCDDVAVLDTLLDHGANIEATGAVIAGGTPLADAVAFGCWKAARRLVERGAQANLWQAAALGMMERMCEALDGASAAEITQAFWLACHGGQRETAEHLLHRGADINWIGYDKLTPLGAAKRSGADALVEWLRAMGGLELKLPAR